MVSPPFQRSLPLVTVRALGRSLKNMRPLVATLSVVSALCLSLVLFECLFIAPKVIEWSSRYSPIGGSSSVATQIVGFSVPAFHTARILFVISLLGLLVCLVPGLWKRLHGRILFIGLPLLAFISALFLWGFSFSLFEKLIVTGHSMEAKAQKKIKSEQE